MYAGLALPVLFHVLLKDVVCGPVLPQTDSPPPVKDQASQQDGLDSLFYKNYLQDVMGQLTQDHDFLAKLTKYTNHSELGRQSSELAGHLELVNRDIRTKLDQLKRKHVDQIRQALKIHSQWENEAKSKGQEGQLPKIDKRRFLAHLDHRNPNSFEVEDLAKLIKQATADLEQVDKNRRDEFKVYEMEKERLRREKVHSLRQEQQKAEEERFQQMKKKHADHPRVHRPGSRDQLGDVWEESDGMAKEDFNPKTFFYMHDLNGDRVLDEQEVEALFQVELAKVYDKNNPEDDMVQRDEEMNRMREHIFKEVDKDNNKVIDFDEFMANTDREKFKDDDGYKTLDQEPVYSEEEIRQYIEEFERRRAENKKAHGP